MTPRRRPPPVRRSARPRRVEREWVGGCFTPPFFVTDQPEPYRMALALWLELPDGRIIAQDAVPEKEQSGLLARALVAALERPLVGPARRPTRLRVDSNVLARELREVAGDSIPVTVAPTPEIDELRESMIEAMPVDNPEPSYLEDGRLPEAAVARLFAAARHFVTLKPWEVAGDGQIVRVDIPAFGVDGACVSIIGALGESLGVVIFPSLEGYEALVRAAELLVPGRPSPDIGTDWLALSFERGADISPAMRREVMAHGWPVASADAYPVVDRRERDGASRPLVERDLDIMAACVSSLSAFFVKHRRWFQVESAAPICESYFDNDDLEVRITAPYEAFPAFDLDEPPPGPRLRPTVGRNAPCPCGSGRKYKKCHLPLDEERHARESQPEASHALDGRVVRRLTRFADRRFGDAWYRFQDDFDDPEEAFQLAIPWSVYGFEIEGRTVLEAYLDEHAAHCSPVERAWLEAQRAAWLSVWEVVAVDPGTALTLRDLLSGETRHVREISGSTTLVVRDALLARVVDHDGLSLLCGVHLRPLPPLEAAEVVRLARGRLRRRRAIPVERLRDGAFGRYLIRHWERAVWDLDARSAVPPILHNSDGDSLLLTTDHYRLAPNARAGVEARLAAIEDAQPPNPDEVDPAYVFLRADAGAASDQATVVGHARISGRELRLETNSRERADALRRRVEAACGDRIRHTARAHADPLSRAAPVAPESPPAPATPELAQIALKFKRRHYADWIDQPIPALDGQTPRETVRTAEGRRAVDVLLKDMENREQRAGGTARFDFSEIRRALRLE